MTTKSARQPGDGERADLLAGEGGANPLLDVLGIAGRDQVRQRNTVGEQGREQPARRTGLMHLLADEDGVRQVTTFAADVLGKARAQQAQCRCLLVQFPRNLTV